MFQSSSHVLGYLLLELTFAWIVWPIAIEVGVRRIGESDACPSLAQRLMMVIQSMSENWRHTIKARSIVKGVRLYANSMRMDMIATDLCSQAIMNAWLRASILMLNLYSFRATEMATFQLV